MKKNKIETRSASVSVGTVANNKKDVILINKPDSPYYGSLPKEADLKHNIPLKTKFFYKIQSTKNEVDFSYEETGVGHIEKKGKNKILVRDRAFYYYSKKEGLSRARNGKINSILHPEDEYLVVSTSIPEDYKKLFSIENSVMCCTDAFCPTPVELQDGTLLGKLNDIIQSIDQNELWTILLQNNRKPVEGSIRYNKRDKCFEGYTGEQWRALMWGDE
jgi:hypothetical protein